MTHDEDRCSRHLAGAAHPDEAERCTWLITIGAMGGAAAVVMAVPFVARVAPSERARAMGAAVQVGIRGIPSGGMKAVEGRGKPVSVVRRTPGMLAAVQYAWRQRLGSALDPSPTARPARCAAHKRASFAVVAIRWKH